MPLSREQTEKWQKKLEAEDTDGAARLMFEWVKTGKASLKDFKDFANKLGNYAWVDGRYATLGAAFGCNNS